MLLSAIKLEVSGLANTQMEPTPTPPVNLLHMGQRKNKGLKTHLEIIMIIKR